MPADNLRFGATAAVSRMKEPCEFEKTCAAESFVEAAAAQSRRHVVGKRRERGEKAVRFEKRTELENFGKAEIALNRTPPQQIPLFVERRHGATAVIEFRASE
jgi:hypothetical protein